MKSLFPAVALLICGCSSVYSVKPSQNDETAEGIYYHLPKNQIRVTIPYTKTVAKPGRFKDHITKCFPHENDRRDQVETANSSIKLGKPEFELLSVVDPEQRYFVDLSKPANPFAHKGGTFNLNQSQVLSSATATASDQTVNFAIGVAEAAVNIAASGLAASGTDPNEKDAVPAGCNDSGAGQVIRAISDIRGKKLELAAAQLGEMSKELYELKMADLDKLEAALLGFFFGEKTVTSGKKVVVIEPDATWTARTTMDLFDTDMNPSANLQPTGANEYKVVARRNAGTKYQVDITPEMAKGNSQKTEQRGFYYRVPGKALVEVREDNKPVAQSSFPIAQFGITRALPSKFGLVKSEITAFTLDPLTGAIQQLSVNGSGLSEAQADAITQTIAADQKDDELQKLQREKAILTLEKELAALRAEAAGE